MKRANTNKICDDNIDTLIATLHSVLLAPYLWDRVFYIITLMNLGHTFLFHRVFCTVYFGARDKEAVTLPHSAQSKHAFLEKIRENLKTKKLPSREKIDL